MNVSAGDVIGCQATGPLGHSKRLRIGPLSFDKQKDISMIHLKGHHPLELLIHRDIFGRKTNPASTSILNPVIFVRCSHGHVSVNDSGGIFNANQNIQEFGENLRSRYFR